MLSFTTLKKLAINPQYGGAKSSRKTQREREIERMIGGLIHDLRTKAQIHIEVSGFLLEGFLGDLNESQRDMLAISLKSGIKGMEMIDHLLDFVKIMDGVYHLNATRFNIYPAIDQSIQRFVGREISAGKKVFVGDVEYKGSLDGEVFVDGDDFFTDRILDNLISNAMKYSVTIISLNVNQNGHMATVCIR